MNRPPVPESTAGKPFWDGTRERVLRMPWCTACDEVIWYPREICPRCLGGDSIEWRDASGRGEVYAVSVQYQRVDQPYAVVLVDLEEGARLMSNVVGCPPEDVRVGQAVEVAWEPLEDGRHLPQFQPLGEGA